MLRKLVLVLVIVAVAAGPALARDDRGSRGEHRRIERVAPHRAYRHVAPRFYSYARTCGWQGGYWGYQPYIDANGGYWYVPQWVPAQYVCS
jgi:hypothetical protein